MLKRVSNLASWVGMLLLATVGTAAAQEGISKPWQMWLQEPGSPVAARLEKFHVLLLAVEVAIVLLVLVIMVYIFIRFNAKRNPVPSKTSHNTVLEFIWTAVPIVILVLIAIPSLRELYFSGRIPDAKMTLKVTGHQWYWSYNYPDNGNISFDSFIVPDKDLKKGQPRLLTVDNPVVLPINTPIRILLSSTDVIHDWAVPSLMLKTDAVPGRTNETWTQLNAVGDYYGQCSELCGINHGFMPIHVIGVTKEDFAKWVAQAKKKYAENGGEAPATVQTASIAGTQ